MVKNSCMGGSVTTIWAEDGGGWTLARRAQGTSRAGNLLCAGK